MSRESTVAVRFKLDESTLDPDDPLDTACARTELGGGFTPAIREAAAAELQTTRLTLSIGASLNGGRARTLSSSTGRGVVGQLSAQVQAGFDDEQAEPGIPFRKNEHCRRWVQGLCWRPSPIAWPTVIPSGLEQDALFIPLSADQEGVELAGGEIEIQWPDDISEWMTPSQYQAAITRTPTVHEDFVPPRVFCDGPIYTSDTQDNPYLSGAGERITGQHGARFRFCYTLSREETGQEVRLACGIAEPRNSGAGVSCGPVTYTIDATALAEGLTLLSDNGALIERGAYTLLLDTFDLYGRIHFNAFAQCLDADGAFQRQTADQWAAFQRPEGIFSGLTEPTNRSPIIAMEIATPWEFEVQIPPEASGKRYIFTEENADLLAHWGIEIISGRQLVLNGSSEGVAAGGNPSVFITIRKPFMPRASGTVEYPITHAALLAASVSILDDAGDPSYTALYKDSLYFEIGSRGVSKSVAYKQEFQQEIVQGETVTFRFQVPGDI